MSSIILEMPNADAEALLRFVQKVNARKQCPSDPFCQNQEVFFRGHRHAKCSKRNGAREGRIGEIGIDRQGALVAQVNGDRTDYRQNNAGDLQLRIRFSGTGGLLYEGSELVLELIAGTGSAACCLAASAVGAYAWTPWFAIATTAGVCVAGAGVT